MPERPKPITLPDILSDHAARIRAVERMNTPPAAKVIVPGECMEMPGEGTPDEPFRMQPQISPEPTNQLTCTDLGLMVGGGQVVGWDAVVDYSATTDTELRLFGGATGISDALEYLASIGLNRALVLVRATGPTTGYVETGNWTNPSQVHLFGVSDATQAQASTLDRRPLWNHNGFSGSNAEWQLHDMQIDFGNKATGFATDAGALQNEFYAERCYFRTDRDVILQIANHTYATYIDCKQDYSCNLGVNVRLVRHGIGDATNLYAVTMATTSLIGDWTIGVSISSPASIDINLPNVTIGRSTVNGGGNGTITYANSAGAAEIYIEGHFDGVNRQALNFGALNRLTIRGSWAKVVHGACLTGADVQCIITQTQSDISGPGIFNIGGLINRLIIRGEAGSGVISFSNTNGNLGATVAVLDFTNADGWALVFAGDNNGFTGKPYAFDASSNNNVILAKDLTTFANAGTDAGTGNRVLPEGTLPFTINGHVIEDEGVGLTQRSNMNFVGAGVTAADSGGKTVVTIPATATINGHVIEDEGTPLTQRATINFTGAGVTATDSAPDTLITIPGVGTPTAGWGSITNVTPDRVYDANASTLDELLDIVGTLIADLVSQGVLAT